MARAKADTFKTYDCLLHIAGDIKIQARKFGVTAPEIMVLGAVHGPDSVLEIKETGDTGPRKDSDERARLREIYEGKESAKAGFVTRVFGPATIPLPREFDADRMPETAVEMRRVSPELAGAIDANAALMG